MQYASDFAHAPYITRCRTVGLRNTGAIMSPFNAFLLLQELETLHVRLPRHEANTRGGSVSAIASPRELSQLPWVSRQLALRACSSVPRRPSPVHHDLHRPRRAGSRDSGVHRVKLFKRLPNMGDAKWSSSELRGEFEPEFRSSFDVIGAENRL